jgi:hypothetical protein
MTNPNPPSKYTKNLVRKFKSLWKKACQYDKIPVTSSFVEFSKDNPYPAMMDELIHSDQPSIAK